MFRKQLYLISSSWMATIWCQNLMRTKYKEVPNNGPGTKWLLRNCFIYKNLQKGKVLNYNSAVGVIVRNHFSCVNSLNEFCSFLIINISHFFWRCLDPSLVKWHTSFFIGLEFWGNFLSKRNCFLVFNPVSKNTDGSGIQQWYVQWSLCFSLYDKRKTS